MKYTAQELENALVDIRINHMSVPEAFHWASHIRPNISYGDGRQRPMEQEELVAAWSAMPLSKRVSLTAALVGGIRRLPECDRLITTAYHDLCTNGKLGVVDE